MKLLLKKDVKHLGMIGDIVDVKQGYARNYLLPQNLAMMPTTTNIKGIAEAKAEAAETRRLQIEEQQAAMARLAEIEITIKAAVNEEGILYGSVGPREIAAALRQEGHSIETEHVHLPEPIRQLDNVMVPVGFGPDLMQEIKVWVVRETAGEPEAQGDSSTEATSDASTAGTEYE
jgi:large subunit ribosomal protein L9